MKKIKSIVIAGVTGALIAGILVLVLGIKFGNWSVGPGESKVTQTTVKEQLVSASDLITTKYHYSNVGRYENSLEINGWSIPLTDKYFILTYEGEALLGVDMSAADVNIAGNTISIELPPIEILSNSIDEKSIEVYNESKNIFNPISVNDYKEFVTKEKESIEKEIKEKNIYETAQQQAVESIQQILDLSAPIKENYTVDVKFKDA